MYEETIVPFRNVGLEKTTLVIVLNGSPMTGGNNLDSCLKVLQENTLSLSHNQKTPDKKYYNLPQEWNRKDKWLGSLH